VGWYDVLKWCNARSQKEGLIPCYYTNAARTTVYKTGQVNVTNNQVLWAANGYRLPTEAEWEKAARGGLDGKRFPWGDTISHSLANYRSLPQNAFFDVSPTGGYHPKYNAGRVPWTSPVGSFAANGYGLYDMSGNLMEWCWDLYGYAYYRSSPEADPKGDDPREDAVSPLRVFRGGSYFNDATYSRLAFRDGHGAHRRFFFMGFRPARGR
jgi:formylglycine-generating enzyme required for sulfatase activity